MMKLGLVSAILPDFTFEEVIDYAAKVGFKCVEVCCWPKGKATRRYAGVTHIDVNGLTREKMDYFKPVFKRPAFKSGYRNAPFLHLRKP